MLFDETLYVLESRYDAFLKWGQLSNRLGCCFDTKLVQQFEVTQFSHCWPLWWRGVGGKRCPRPSCVPTHLEKSATAAVRVRA